MIWVRSLLFNLAFYAWTAFVSIGFFPSVVYRPLNAWVPYIWGNGMVLICRWVAGIKLEVRGLENLPERPFIIACKHQSAWETCTLSALILDAALIFKKELLYIPFYGWQIWANQNIAIDRNAGASAMRRMLRAVDRAKRDTRPIIIYPEGTRTPPDAEPDLQPGVAGIYKHSQLPVVPTALNSGLYWPRRKFLKQPGTIVVSFLPPIAPGLDRKAFMERLHTEMNQETRALVAESRVRDNLPVDKPGA